MSSGTKAVVCVKAAPVTSKSLRQCKLVDAPALRICLSSSSISPAVSHSLSHFLLLCKSDGYRSVWSNHNTHETSTQNNLSYYLTLICTQGS